MIWIDVEDLFRYVRSNARPSGIQRVEYELCRALAEMEATKDIVRFIRHKPLMLGYLSVPFHTLDQDFRNLATGGGEQARPVSDQRDGPARPQRSLIHRTLKAASDRLPLKIRVGVVNIYFHQREAFLAVGELARGLFGLLRDRLANRHVPQEPISAEEQTSVALAVRAPDPESSVSAGPDEFERDVRPGDVVMLLGSAWFPCYADMIQAVLKEKQVRLALLMYDIVPLRRPEWCDSVLTRNFTNFVHGVLPLADVLLTISRASAADIERYALQTGLELRSLPIPIPMGTGFTIDPIAASVEASAEQTSRLPPAGSYALIVSTIEARKNHALLLRVWRRLLDEMPRDNVPTLVFAGRVGWLVTDLMAQLRNAAFLDGKIVLIEDPTDLELKSLYQGCLFTLFPSFYEGWGLPVTESLGYGAPCIISSATSLPEAGGALARYFDPDEVADAYEVIRAAIEDPADLALWRARIVREFRPVSWEASAKVILAALDPPAPASVELDLDTVVGMTV